ncbi:sulfotransferase family 2 domain-containing protein [Aliiroseovarius sp. YM-037]|uniref:sulfotransferase family 2 domain-containing protein n=1 Tax=Aliiroseovarius sp. YM-037 TaxID=3341728 RepID=UPI003A80D5E6
MIVSRGRRYIFVHIPKTGGTSLALALEARAMKDDIMLGDTPKAVRRRRRVRGMATSGRLWKHSRLTDIYGLVSQEEIESFFVFTLVRNPWDRMVSYYHWLRDQSFDHPAVELSKQVGFSPFLNAPETVEAFRSSGLNSYIRDRNGAERCDHFIRLEYLTEDIAPLQKHLGFTLDIPHVNSSERTQDYRAAYDDADIALVADLFTDEVERFGYRFE